MTQSLLGTYLHFLRSPNLNDPPIAVSVPKAAKSILRLYSVHLMFLLVALGLIGLVVPNVQDSNNLLDSLEDTPVWYLPFAAVVMAPVLEELFFRLPLRASIFNLLVPIVLLSLFASNLFAAQGTPVQIVLFAPLAIAFFVLQSSRIKRLKAFYNRYALIIFYTVALLFGAVHIANYDIEVWLFLPILVLPQVVIGLLLGFVRLRYGLSWAVILHAFHNGCLLLPIFLIQIFGSNNLQESLTEPLEPATLSLLDQAIASAVGFYSIGGIILCGVIAWRVIREWKSRSNTTTR